ncbi:hypothetical protein K2173_026419 [Erythroxylum novogranatense]|uniref:Homeobox domain-containing protein n=1 Tax=Erythroxylum novogranatense TaxID=1862640 RepID=A0AAV8SNV3_9ROSI|nr:hypothetical protein K2173_026419 [Erythroxylum novogranatense]
MWIMGFNDSGEFNMLADNLSGRKLRTLMPRAIPSTNNTSSSSFSPLGRLHDRTDLFPTDHQLATASDQGKEDYKTQPVAVSSRWNPTPEQLRTLEGLYRRGTRTPSADEIQHITAQLRRYGKIEGKNVFYWFQNHKARERQKRRRQMEPGPDYQQQYSDNIEIIERKETEASRTGYEGVQNKNRASSTLASTLSEESASNPRQTTATKAVVAAALDEGELQYLKSFTEENATWKMMKLPCPSRVNTTSTSTSTTTTATKRTMEKRLIKTHDLNFFRAHRKGKGHGFVHFNNSTAINEEDGCCGESHTLQLFPLHNCTHDSTDLIIEKEPQISVTAPIANLGPHQFFEFLPLKN